MTEENLTGLSLDELYELMVTTIDEYLALHKLPETTMQVEIKRAELFLIQKLIEKRKAATPI